jgi:hypothetical protein
MIRTYDSVAIVQLAEGVVNDPSADDLDTASGN